MKSYKNILYAVEIDKNLNDFLPKAIEKANSTHVNLHIFHAIKSTNTTYGAATGYIPLESMTELENKLKVQAESSLNEITTTHPLASGSVTVTISDNPKEDIINKASDLNADAIYLNGHNHSLIGRLGSVADYVINHAQCDVVVLKS